MRRIALTLLCLAIPVASLGAQLTADQRAEREARADLSQRSKRFAEQFDRGTAEGDWRWNWGGVVAHRSQFGWGGRWEGGGVPLVASSAPMGVTHWVAFTRSGVRPARLAPSSTQPFAGPAKQSGRVTLASSAGAPGAPLVIRVAIIAADGATSWDQANEVTGDDMGRYTILTPGLPRGTYSMKIDVYEMGSSVTPFSTSSEALTIE